MIPLLRPLFIKNALWIGQLLVQILQSVDDYKLFFLWALLFASIIVNGPTIF